MVAKQSPVSPSEYQTLATFRHALRRFLRFSEDAAVAAGITPQQHQALLAIKGFSHDEPISIGTLAESLQIAHHSAVGLVDRLVRNDLVTRSRSERDRRQIHLSLTKSGESLLRKLSTAHREELRRIAPEIQTLLEQILQSE